MSLRSDKVRLEFILQLINDIEEIINRHHGVRPAVSDMEGHHALMMCCLQIGEVMGKISNPSCRDLLPISLASALRNMIAHDYLGISPDRIAETLEISIPELKSKIEFILGTIE
jgi:uncharacterized protein with HEPN domain